MTLGLADASPLSLLRLAHATPAADDGASAGAAAELRASSARLVPYLCSLSRPAAPRAAPLLDAAATAALAAAVGGGRADAAAAASLLRCALHGLHGAARGGRADAPLKAAAFPTTLVPLRAPPPRALAVVVRAVAEDDDEGAAAACGALARLAAQAAEGVRRCGPRRARRRGRR